VQVTRATFIPLLTSAHSDRVDPSAVRDECFGELTVVYTFGPDFGRRVVTHADLDQLQVHPRMLRQSALQHLEVLSSRAEFHGQPPALMLSFEGLESSLLLATDFWSRLEGAVPGELVVGVPARDVVIVTGSQSGPGLEKAKRCVERVFFAGGENLIARGLMVRRGGTWEPFDRAARPSGRPTFGPAHQHGIGQPPREYQEHASWPGERVPLQSTGSRPRMNPGAAGAPGRHGPVRRRPMYPMVPAAGLDSTGSHQLGMTGSHQLGMTGSHQLGMTGSHQLGMTGSHAPVSAMTGQMPVSRQSEAAYRDYAAEVAEAAQYSAVPYSAMPYSAAPYSASPYSIAPQSIAPNSMSPHGVAPHSIAPYSAMPYSSVPYQQPGRARSPQDTGSRYPYREQQAGLPSYREQPTYQDEPYSTGNLPRAAYPDYAPPSEQQPTYPASWGSAPDSPAPRSEFRSGPRARFSR
jgi:hypothetical protein